MNPGFLLLIAAGCVVAGIGSGRCWPRLWLALTVTGAASAVGAALVVLTGADEWDWRGTIALGGELPHLRLDAVSALFLVLLAVVGATGALYARDYWSDRDYPGSAPRSREWWSMLMLCMGLVLTVSNGLHFLIVWELFAVSGYFLITLENKRAAVRAAGWLYLAASHAGTLMLFALFANLAAHTGSWDLGPMREQPQLAPLFWFALFGFGVKAGLFPLHVWLPSAHANAPSHVSAIMSGVAIKMGVYGIVRFSGWLPLPTSAGWVVIGLGALGALLGITFAFVQNDFKRLLAYCSVENVGVILIGLGAAMLAITYDNVGWGRLALAGALLHVWNHGAFKSLLFFGAGSVLHATGTREMSRLGGLWQAMPWTAGFFALGVLAVSSLPPLNGFVSEWLIYIGLIDAIMSKAPVAWIAIPAVIMLALAGALALASFVKAGAMIFLGTARTQPARQAHECGRWMLAPMLALAAVCVVIGLTPVIFWPALVRATSAWHPSWSLTPPPVPLATLGWVHGVFAIAAVGAAVCLWRKTQELGRPRNLTWDCGYTTPTARMQYTGGAFSGIAAGWFSWLLQPTRNLRRPRGMMPAAAFRLERMPETVLERVMTPAGEWVMRASTAVRRLQHGRLQAYILYVVAGIAVLGGGVILGSKL